MTARILLHAIPADTAATDAAALAAAVSDLGPLALVMVCASLVLVVFARGLFPWLAEREKRLMGKPPSGGRSNTPPAGTHVDDLRALQERVRALELASEGARVSMGALQDELRRDLVGVREAQNRMAVAIDEMSKQLAGMTVELSHRRRDQ